MARCFCRKMGANERGAAAVEFALVVPFFFLLVFGVVDFGYMINRDTLVNNASREGAREGALNPTTNAIKCKVRQELAPVTSVGGGADCSPSAVTVTITCRKADNSACSFPAEAVSGGTVIVKVDYTYTWITPAGSTLKPGGLPLTKTTEMRIE